jgi:hypothetical protein
MTRTRFSNTDTHGAPGEALVVSFISCARREADKTHGSTLGKSFLEALQILELDVSESFRLVIPVLDNFHGLGLRQQLAHKSGKKVEWTCLNTNKVVSQLSLCQIEGEVSHKRSVGRLGGQWHILTRRATLAIRWEADTRDQHFPQDWHRHDWRRELKKSSPLLPNLSFPPSSSFLAAATDCVSIQCFCNIVQPLTSIWERLHLVRPWSQRW